MTRYMDKDRRDWRAKLHRLIRRYRALLAVAVLLAGLLPSAANAAPRCPNGGTATPQGCSYERPGMTCAWPLRVVKVGNVAYCWITEPGVGR